MSEGIGLKGREESRGRGDRSVILNCHVAVGQILHSSAVILRWVKKLDVLDRKAKATGPCFDVVWHPN